MAESVLRLLWTTASGAGSACSFCQQGAGAHRPLRVMALSCAVDKTAVARMSQRVGWSWLSTTGALIAHVNFAAGLLQTQKLREEAREEKHQLAKDKRLTWQQKVECL